MNGTLLETQSADGTEIAYETDGSGPPLILVGGAMSTRGGAAAALVPLLADRFTVVRYDRRGRGDSGDTPPYAPEREIEDLQALVAAVGGPVLAYGHSSGAALVLHLARSGAPISKMVLYEPPFITDDARELLPADHLEHLAGLAPGDAIEYFMTVAVGVPAPVVEGMKASPMWAELVPLGHTLINDNRIMWPYQQGRPLPAEWADEVGPIPTLVLDGANSPTWMRNSVQATTDLLHNARRFTLEGCDHGAPPETIAAVLSDFYGEDNRWAS